MARPGRYMADLSNNNRSFDAHAYRKAGHRVIGLKATEGVGAHQGAVYTNRVRAAHKAGLKVIHYHFARPDHHANSTAEARDFLSVVKPNFRKGDRVALDLEVEAPGVNLQRYADQFAFECACAGFHHGWFYTFTAYLNEHRLRPPKGWRLWEANFSAPVPRKGAWTHQYTNGSTGPGPRSLAGVGHCDVSQMTRRAAIGLRVA